MTEISQGCSRSHSASARSKGQRSAHKVFTPSPLNPNSVLTLSTASSAARGRKHHEGEVHEDSKTEKSQASSLPLLTQKLSERREVNKLDQANSNGAFGWEHTTTSAPPPRNANMCFSNDSSGQMDLMQVASFSPKRSLAPSQTSWTSRSHTEVEGSSAVQALVYSKQTPDGGTSEFDLLIFTKELFVRFTFHLRFPVLFCVCNTGRE